MEPPWVGVKKNKCGACRELRREPACTGGLTPPSHGLDLGPGGAARGRDPRAQLGDVLHFLAFGPPLNDR